MSIKNAIFCYNAFIMKNVRTAKFIKGVVEADEILEEKKPYIAFIGRSNVGKSSVINSLTNQKGLAKTSSFPGRTQQINVFLINNAFYLIDLPGYGFSRVSAGGREQITSLINWYLFDSDYLQQKVVFILDANVGLTDKDFSMLRSLEDHQKNVVVVANKVDKIKKSVYEKQFRKIQTMVGPYKIIPYSSVKGIGVNDLMKEILQ